LTNRKGDRRHDLHRHRPPVHRVHIRLARLRRLAWLIDGAFRLPGTSFRFGLNSAIGLLPVGGDAVLGVVSLYIIYEAARLGLPKNKLAQMLAYVGVEVIGGSIPVIGDVFDMVLKANLRNLAIIDDHVRQTGRLD
jgi:hypothetical protein